MSDFRLTTPVVFIIFNRPDTTQVVFDEIRKAKPLKLLVIADGPRTERPGETEQCILTRAIIDQVDWKCEVLKHYSEANMGCKNRIASGLDWAFSIVEEAIILEDDCVPHQSFFQYCQELLEKYRDDKRIMMISGTNHMVDQYRSQYSYFFSRHFTIWGWATWRRAWATYDVNMTAWRSTINSGHLKYLCSDWIMKKHFEQTFDLIHFNNMNTWDFQWVFNCLFNNGLCITPASNLIENIGVDGTHSSEITDSHFLKRIGVQFGLRHPSYVFPDFQYDEYLFKNKSKDAVLKQQIRSTMQKNVISRGLFYFAREIYRFAKSF